MQKLPFWGTAFDEKAQFYQLVSCDYQNCKTFMRRFDPDSRLQFLQTLILEMIEVSASGVISDRCIGPNSGSSGHGYWFHMDVLENLVQVEPERSRTEADKSTHNQSFLNTLPQKYPGERLVAQHRI